MTFFKNAALVSIVLALTACGNSTDTAPSNDPLSSDTQTTLSSDESEIIRSEDEVKELAQSHQEDDGDQSGNKSVYSNLSLETCELVESGTQNSSKTYKCSGYKDWDIYARDAEGHFTLAVGQAPDFLVEGQPPNTLGHKIEWRLKDGEPHALIYRLNFDESEGLEADKSLLVVASLPAKGESGCAQALVKQNSEQTKAARRYADMLSAASECPNNPAILSGK